MNEYKIDGGWKTNRKRLLNTENRLRVVGGILSGRMDEMGDGHEGGHVLA